MKRVIILGMFGLWASLGYAQSVSGIKADRVNYVWGEGKGNTLKKADNEALADLINQISTTVESRFVLLREEKKDGDFSESFHSVINTYSAATLNNTQRMIISDEPEAQVVRYIKRSEIDRIFETRKFKIQEYVSAAQEAENHLQLADALRYYYWAQTLLRSHPDGASICIKDAGGEERLLATWLPLRINTLFARLTVNVVRVIDHETYRTMELSVCCDGRPVRNFDYTYWDGRDWSNIVSAKDGRGIAELPVMADISSLRLKAEYVFEGEAVVDAELRDVLSRLDVVPYRSCYLEARQMKLPEHHPVIAVDRQVMTEGTTADVGHFFKPLTDSSRYLEVVRRVEQAVREQQYEAVRDCFEPEGYEMFTRLIRYGRARVVGTPDYRVTAVHEGVICRSLPLSFHFAGTKRVFVEDIVFDFSVNDRIRSLSFGLSQAALADIVTKDKWNEESRMTLIRFLENYKTAYALKRLDYVERIFADDALIIVGSVLERTKTDDMRQVAMNTENVRYVRQNKEQYIRRLRNTFASNEFINLRFADSRIRKSGTQGEIYGIQIHQDYFSTNYGDTGYLFLMVDLNNPEKPVIYVRAWQPEKDPDFGLIDLSHFTF